MLGPAILSYISAILGRASVPLLGSPLIERPIFMGLLCGILLGDIQYGIILGAQMELIFLGVTNIGGVQGGTDLVGATTVAAGIGISQGIPMEIILPVGVTLAFAGFVFTPIRWVTAELLLPFIDKSARTGKRLATDIRCQGFNVLAACAQFFWVFFAVFFGAEFLNMLMEKAPAVVLDGLRAASTILPGVGFAIIISMIWNKKLAVYFFLGFFLYKYLPEVNIIFLFIIAFSIAAIDYLRSRDTDEKLKKLLAKAKGSSKEEGSCHEQ